MHPYQAKICDISNLQSGMRLASPVYDFNGKMLLSQGVVLSAKHISLLQNLLIMQVTIWEDRPSNLVTDELATEEEATVAETFDFPSEIEEPPMEIVPERKELLHRRRLSKCFGMPFGVNLHRAN